MKRIFFKKDKAVSPIIATILIIAITVILAAVLYAVVGGYGGLLAKPTPTAGVTVADSGVGTGSAKYTFSITDVNGNVSLTNVELRLFNGTTVATSGPLSTYLSSSSSSFTFGTTKWNIDVTGGKYLTSSTTLTLCTPTPSSSSTTGLGDMSVLTSFDLIDTATGGTIASSTITS